MQLDAFGDGLQQPVADGMAERIVDELEVVEVDAQHSERAVGASALRQCLGHAHAEEDAVGQVGQGVVVRHVGDARLRLFAFGDIDHGDQHGRHTLVVEDAREHDDLDRIARAGAVLASEDALGEIFACRRRRPGVLILQIDQRHGDDRVASIPVVRDRRRVGGEERLRVAPQHEHRHGVFLEQQAEGGLALLQGRDVHAQADDAAVAGAPLLDQDAAAVGQRLLVLQTRAVEEAEALGDPLLLAPLGCGIVAARHADAQRVLELRAHLEEIGAALVDVGVFLVPQDVAALGIEKHDALRQYLQGLAQPLMRRVGGGHGGAGFRAGGFQLRTAG